MKKKLLSLLLAVLLFSTLLPTLPAHAAGEKLIAVTFDDGPSQYTSTLLDGLKERGVHATFFMQGINAESYPAIVKRAWMEGHQICSHTYNHPQLTNLSVANIQSQLSRTDGILDKALGFDLTYMLRPPYGAYNQTVLNTAGVPCFYWSVDTRDWESRNADSVYNMFLRYAKDGSVVLLHDLYPTSVSGALRAIDTLKSQGYQFVTVAEMFFRRGIELKNATIYFDAYPGSAGTSDGIQTPTITKSVDSSGMKITIAGDSRGSVYYTTNGETPTPANATKYTGPFTVSGTCTIKAMSVVSWNSVRSNVASESIEYIPAPAPELSYADGHVTMKSSAGNAVIRYTTDCSTPNGSSAVYSGPVAVEPNTTVQAIAEASGLAPSTVSLLTVTGDGKVMRDVKVTSWYYKDLSAAVSQGIINGTAPEVMSPNSNLNRAMLVAMLYRMSGVDAEYPNVNYSDVSTSSYYYKALCWATAEEIVKGYTDGTFQPNSDINRTELCAMLSRYLKYKGYDLPEGEAGINRFADAKDISSWAKWNVSAMAELGIVNGYTDGTFGPKLGATRAEAVAMLMRSLALPAPAEETTDEPDATTPDETNTDKTDETKTDAASADKTDAADKDAVKPAEDSTTETKTETAEKTDAEKSEVSETEATGSAETETQEAPKD